MGQRGGYGTIIRISIFVLLHCAAICQVMSCDMLQRRWACVHISTLIFLYINSHVLKYLISQNFSNVAFPPDSPTQLGSSSLMCKVSLQYKGKQCCIQVGRVYTSHFGGSLFGCRPERKPRLLRILVSVPDKHIYCNCNYTTTASCHIFSIHIHYHSTV
jgi:hypothetical protein